MKSLNEAFSVYFCRLFIFLHLKEMAKYHNLYFFASTGVGDSVNDEKFVCVIR